jgi:hypothetical protein
MNCLMERLKLGNPGDYVHFMVWRHARKLDTGLNSGILEQFHFAA